ncbi:uncharacterized protein BDR25DRAFT_53583 [Lindgomyces ingoldianus]|uniref:Uncharacterized protein n=1 Tax=Lindgomyces ingoldianus TaxID=673940 RepID=A0ACB6QPD8_9PLEO|nr:uncharacterized protein BDR25DRAFT_53583 [Lindgomyces ingoldianus]KAF2468849.1 hypothetical protein BDR25DRAFT_53583 [Lindgomyces ingoldianus]
MGKAAQAAATLVFPSVIPRCDATFGPTHLVGQRGYVIKGFLPSRAADCRAEAVRSCSAWLDALQCAPAPRRQTFRWLMSDQ